MANTKSAIKRIRRISRQSIVNKSRRSKFKKAIKKAKAKGIPIVLPHFPVAEGFFADVVVFDADRMIDTATYDDPKQYPIGIPFVLVNGQVAVDHERCTGVMAGQAIP